jgi:hypothetical protein
LTIATDSGEMRWPLKFAESDGQANVTDVWGCQKVPARSHLVCRPIVGGVMRAVRRLRQKGLQDWNSEVIYERNAGFHGVQVHIVKKSAKMTVNESRWTSSKSDSYSPFPSSKPWETKQFTPSCRPP